MKKLILILSIAILLSCEKNQDSTGVIDSKTTLVIKNNTNKIVLSNVNVECFNNSTYVNTYSIGDVLIDSSSTIIVINDSINRANIDFFISIDSSLYNMKLYDDFKIIKFSENIITIDYTDKLRNTINVISSL